MYFVTTRGIWVQGKNLFFFVTRLDALGKREIIMIVVLYIILIQVRRYSLSSKAKKHFSSQKINKFSPYHNLFFRTTLRMPRNPDNITTIVYRDLRTVLYDIIFITSYDIIIIYLVFFVRLVNHRDPTRDRRVITQHGRV